ncbi:MAG: MBL fold metallo-hydrolase [Syntrophorhabdaceae bacterium]|nr:MBL fold metallo-hydrolase [Syntrophorhabdaceae bacterium]
MIFGTTGHVEREVHVTGFAWSPCYLLNSGTPVLFEAGFYSMGPLYVRDIRKVVADRDPGFLFLTHVHYDHCGAAAYFKRMFPGIKICASKRASEILSRPNAIDLMTSLSSNFTRLAETSPEIDGNTILHSVFEPFDVDVIFDEEKIFTVDASISIRVLFTPGHTRDMLSYYIPERRILIATESAGCRSQTGQIVSEFLVDFDAYITSLKRLAALDSDIFCQGHHFVYTGSDVKDFFDSSLEAAFTFRRRVLELLEMEKDSVEKVVERIKQEEYDPNPGPKQPEKAYLLNLKTRVAHLAGKTQQHRNR